MNKIVFICIFIGMLTACQDVKNTLAEVAEVNYSEEKYEQAIINYTLAIDEVSNTAEPDTLAALYFKRAEAKRSLALNFLPSDKDLHDALTDYSKAIDLYPYNSIYFRNRGDTLVQLGDYDSALVDFEAISNGDLYWSMVRIGGLHRLLGDYEQALVALNEVSTTWEPTMPVNYHMAWAHNDFGEYQKAIESIKAGLLAQDDYGHAYLRMACSKAMLQRYDEALENLKQGSNLLSKFVTPTTKHFPKNQHNIKTLKENEQHLENLKAGVSQLTSQISESLCNGLWWDIHYDKVREKSPLLSNY